MLVKFFRTTVELIAENQEDVDLLRKFRNNGVTIQGAPWGLYGKIILQPRDEEGELGDDDEDLTEEVHGDSYGDR